MMERILRRFAEWRGRRKGAQIIIFDGGQEVERTRSFLKGAFVGGGLAMVAFVLTGPTALDPELASEIRRREVLMRESNRRAEQAIRVADVCLSTAQNLERTLGAYQSFLRGSPSTRSSASPTGSN